LHPAGRCPNNFSLFPPLAAVVVVAPIEGRLWHTAKFPSSPVPLPLGEVAAKQTERARMLPEKHWHSDSIALTKSLLIAAQRL